MASEIKEVKLSSWSRGYDPKYERYYYYSYERGISQWEIPDDYREETEITIDNNRLSRSFQSLRENFEAQRDQVILNLRRRSGLAIHLEQSLRTPDSDDESDADDPITTTPTTTPNLNANNNNVNNNNNDNSENWSSKKINAYENWKNLVLKVLQQQVNWDSVSYVIHLAAAKPLPPPGINILQANTSNVSSIRKSLPTQTPSHLTVAKNKSLFLQDVLAARNRLFLSQIEKNTSTIPISISTEIDTNNINSRNSNNNYNFNDDNNDDYDDFNRSTTTRQTLFGQLDELQKWSEQNNNNNNNHEKREDTKPYTAPTLLELNEQYDVLGGMNVDLSSEHSSISELHRQQSGKYLEGTNILLHPLLKPLNKLINILNEFIFTERTFVSDMNKLLLLLAELRYSTLPKVREFTSSAAFTGIYFATETINLVNTQFLQSMLNSKPSDELLIDSSSTISASASSTSLSSNQLPPPPPPLSPSLQLQSQSSSSTLNSTPSYQLSSPPIPATFTDSKRCFEYSSKYCESIFQSLQHFAPLFRLFSQFIVTHDSLSLLYSTLSFEDPEFSTLLVQYEKLLGESLLSLIIKPVQRLPRYVLLCKEIHHTLTKAYLVCQDLKLKNEIEIESETEVKVDGKNLFQISIDEDEIITNLEKKAREVHNIIAECAKQCNNTVRTHQDNLRMHQLFDMFREGGVNIPIVKNDRAIIKEGELKRHHKHAGIKSHEIQIFSDILLSSTPSGKGLKLEQVFSLGRGSDTLCLPIPSRGANDPESNWFVLVSDDKTLFYGAKSHQDMLRWVEAIHDCLIKNKADSDMYLIKNQIALVNTLIGEINRRRKDYVEKNPSILRQSTRQRSSSYERSYIETTNSIQASWWHLLDLLEELCIESNEVHTVTHLRRVIEHHSKEVVSRLMLTISCEDDDVRKGPNIIQTLLFNDTIRYIIAIGVFFSYSLNTTSSIIDGERPQIIKLFLLSDVLIGTVLETVKDNLTYLFHIKLENLQCSDYREGVSDYAIQLVDLSTMVRRRMSILLNRSNQSEYTKYVLYASTIDMKFDWLSLMMQAVEGYKYYQQNKPSTSSSPTISTNNNNNNNNHNNLNRHTIDYFKQIPLQRIESSLLRCSWVAETKSLPSDMI